MNFTQQELTDIARWAEKEIRGSRYDPAVQRARRIQAKVSAALADVPSALPPSPRKPYSPVSAADGHGTGQGLANP